MTSGDASKAVEDSSQVHGWQTVYEPPRKPDSVYISSATFTRDQEVWLRVYCAAMTCSGVDTSAATSYANEAVEQFNERFSK